MSPFFCFSPSWAAFWSDVDSSRIVRILLLEEHKHTDVFITVYFTLRPHKCKKKKKKSPVVDFVGCWEAFSGPVEETVKKDKAGESGPAPHDGLEGEACIVDQLGRGQDTH